jgi:hypothetical protein
MEFRDVREEAALTAWEIFNSVQARSNVPTGHQPEPLILLTATGRYSKEHSIFSESKVSLAGIVRVAKYFRISEWKTISKGGSDVVEAALQWVNQADLHGDDYWHHYYRILRRKGGLYANEFLLGTYPVVLLHPSFDLQARIFDGGMAGQSRPLTSAQGARPAGLCRNYHLK